MTKHCSDFCLCNAGQFELTKVQTNGPPMSKANGWTRHSIVERNISPIVLKSPHGVRVSGALFVVVVMVGETPDTTAVLLASTLLTNPALSHSVLRGTS